MLQHYHDVSFHKLVKDCKTNHYYFLKTFFSEIFFFMVYSMRSLPLDVWRLVIDFLPNSDAISLVIALWKSEYLPYQDIVTACIELNICKKLFKYTHNA